MRPICISLDLLVFCLEHCYSPIKRKHSLDLLKRWICLAELSLGRSKRQFFLKG